MYKVPWTGILILMHRSLLLLIMRHLKFYSIYKMNTLQAGLKPVFETIKSE